MLNHLRQLLRGVDDRCYVLPVDLLQGAVPRERRLQLGLVLDRTEDESQVVAGLLVQGPNLRAIDVPPKLGQLSRQRGVGRLVDPLTGLPVYPVVEPVPVGVNGQPDLAGPHDLADRRLPYAGVPGDPDEHSVLPAMPPTRCISHSGTSAVTPTCTGCVCRREIVPLPAMKGRVCCTRENVGVRVVQKACACVVRGAGDLAELLVFDHPTAGTQLPKGTVEPREQPAQAVLRELAEETGLSDLGGPRLLGVWTRTAGAGPEEAGALEQHDWFVFRIDADNSLPDAWAHAATGSAEEEGLVFGCRWVQLRTCRQQLHPLFRDAAELVLADQRTFGG